MVGAPGGARLDFLCASQSTTSTWIVPATGNGGEGADHAGQLGADEHGDQDDERRELHGAAVDDRLQDVVLELLVENEEDQHDDPGLGRVEERDGRHGDGGDRRSCERDEVEDGDEEAERKRVRHAQRREHERRGDSGDDADRQVAGDVAADRLVDLIADRPPPRLLLLRQQPVEALDPFRPFEQHEQGEKRDRQGGDDRGDDALGHGERRIGQAQELRRASFGQRIPHALGDLILALEEAELAAPRRQVLDVGRHGVDEVVHLRDDRRHDRRRQAGDHEDRTDERDPDREAAAPDAVRQQPLDRGVQRQREEHRDADPDQDALRRLDDPDHHDGGEDDPEHDEDRARAEVDEPLLQHQRRG